MRLPWGQSFSNLIGLLLGCSWAAPGPTFSDLCVHRAIPSTILLAALDQRLPGRAILRAVSTFLLHEHFVLVFLLFFRLLLRGLHLKALDRVGAILGFDHLCPGPGAASCSPGLGSSRIDRLGAGGGTLVEQRPPILPGWGEGGPR